MGRVETRIVETARTVYGPDIRVILYGSRARGDYFNDSDWDIAIISPRFASTAFVKRPVAFYRAWNGAEPVEVLCYTPEEFEKNRLGLGLAHDVATQGVVLADRA